MVFEVFCVLAGVVVFLGTWHLWGLYVPDNVEPKRPHLSIRTELAKLEEFNK